MSSALTLEQQDAIWDRWRAGEPARMIARAVRCGPAAVRRHLALTGGIRPLPRSRAALRLSLVEREEISRGIAAGESARAIASRIGRSASSVSREIARNGGRDAYRAANADAATWERARRPKASKLDRHEGLRELVRLKLTDDWSPERIAAWLRRSSPTSPSGGSRQAGARPVTEHALHPRPTSSGRGPGRGGALGGRSCDGCTAERGRDARGTVDAHGPARATAGDQGAGRARPWSRTSEPFRRSCCGR